MLGKEVFMIEARKVVIPKEAEKEITFMLFNYQNIDNLIEKRKKDLIENINISNNAWLKSLNESANTLEDVVIKFDSDKTILKLKRWKLLINSFNSRLYDNENPVYYWLIRLKYMDKVEENTLLEKLDIDKEELKNLDIYLKWKLYCLAVERNLFDGGEVNV